VTLVRRLARDDRGQSLVLAVVCLFTLVLLLGLVIDVGAWLHAQRRAQSVADAAALAGAQELPFDQVRAAAVARTYSENNWSGAQPALSFPDGSTIQVDVSHDAPGLFAPLAGIAGVTVHAHASARVAPPPSVEAVAPLGLSCENCGWEPGSSARLSWRPGNRAVQTNGFGALRLSGGDFETLMTCDPRQPTGGNCSRTVGQGSIGRDSSVSGEDFRSALSSVRGAPRLVSIYDDASRTSFHVIGWALFVVNDVDVTRNRFNQITRIDVDGHFTSFLVDSNKLAQPSSQDFGVRAIGLVG
jgi:hypothetical protein